MEQVDSAMPRKSNQSSPQKSQQSNPTTQQQTTKAKNAIPTGVTNSPNMTNSPNQPGAQQIQPKAEKIGLCPLCRKTQLARGCGHKCGFCFTLFCSRCGGKAQVCTVGYA